jgi:transcriptional regulator with GAF, ATPase, and Fis domain
VWEICFLEGAQLTFCWTLHEVAKDLGTAKNLPAILNFLVKNAVDALKIKASSIRLLDFEGEKLELVAAYGLSEEYLKKGPVEVSKSPIDKEAMTGKVVLVEDVTSGVQYPSEAIREGIKSMMCVPLVVRDKVIGSLRAYTSSPRIFADTEKMFLSGLANLGAIAIENAKITESLRKRSENMSRLVELSRRIPSSLKVSEVFETIVREASEILNAKGATLSILDKGRFEIISSHGLSKEFTSKLMAATATEGSEVLDPAIVVSNVERSTLPYKGILTNEGMKAMLGASMHSGGKAVGVLKAYFSEKREFDSGEPELFSILASLGEISMKTLNYAS